MNTLQDLPLARVWQAQHRAQLRIQIYAMGRTHELLGEMAKQARGILTAEANADGKLNALAAQRALDSLHREWSATLNNLKTLMMGLRRESASLPFGALAVYQDRLVNPALEKAQNEKQKAESALQPSIYHLSAADEREFLEAGPVTDYVFRPQLRDLMDATARHVYGDGLNLSQRIWRFDRESWSGIQATLYNGMAQGSSAWDMAKQMEQYLGASQDCPRWTSTRLYKLDKKAIAAGDTRGLLRGNECDGRGVAYNALRMTRTEIQRVHGQATDEIMQRMPWIEQERIYLSGSHPVKDICDKVVEGGENGQGIYPKGQIKLPLHPQCLCQKEAVMQKPEDFASNLRGWMAGTQSWGAMDQYAAMLGKNSNSFGVMDIAKGAIVNSLADWLWAGPKTLDARVDGAVAGL